MDIETLYQLYRKHPVVTTDSRNCPAGSIFIALKGASFNGNTFARQALEKGCAYAVVDEPEYANDTQGRILLTDNCLQTLQLLARLHRRTLGTPVIGITGTNGKTTTKELTAAVLTRKYNLLYTQGNLNNQIGVPLTLLRLRPEHELAIIEMGASHPGDIDELVHIAEPDYGLITNVGQAHLEGFGTFEGVVRTKGELYRFLQKRKGTRIFIHHENPFLKQMAEELAQIEYGTENGLFVQGKSGACNPYLSFEWKRDTDPTWHKVQTKLIGGYNLENALAAVAIGSYFNVEPQQINEALETYVPQNNRSQLKETGRNQLIIDAYNANPTSMTAALENFRQLQASHKMVILADMKELGNDSVALHQQIADLVSECSFERVILVGREFQATHTSLQVVPDVESLIRLLQQEQPEGYHILIKGSNSMKLPQAVEYL